MEVTSANGNQPKLWHLQSRANAHLSHMDSADVKPTETRAHQQTKGRALPATWRDPHHSLPCITNQVYEQQEILKLWLTTIAGAGK